MQDYKCKYIKCCVESLQTADFFVEEGRKARPKSPNIPASEPTFNSLFIRTTYDCALLIKRFLLNCQILKNVRLGTKLSTNRYYIFGQCTADHTEHLVEGEVYVRASKNSICKLNIYSTISNLFNYLLIQFTSNTWHTYTLDTPTADIL